jgi:hypothetical protein
MFCSPQCWVSGSGFEQDPDPDPEKSFRIRILVAPDPKLIWNKTNVKN